MAQAQPRLSTKESHRPKLQVAPRNWFQGKEKAAFVAADEAEKKRVIKNESSGLEGSLKV